jgi:hypothetical protein
MSNEPRVNEQRADRPNPQPGDEVKIVVNNAVILIHRGRRTVAEIKTAGSVPLADELDQFIDNNLTELPDDGSVTIKGGEVFVSHVRSGGSS